MDNIKNNVLALQTLEVETIEEINCLSIASSTSTTSSWGTKTGG